MSAELDITINRSSPVPLYHQVASALERAIRDGSLPAETKLENEVALAKRYNLSRPTMRQAMDRLVRDGLVIRRRGVGTQVVGAPVRRNLRLSSLYNDLQDEGATPTTRVVRIEETEATAEVAQMLHLDEGAPVLYLERVRLVDERPLALMENWIPTGIAEFTEQSLERDGLYNQLRRQGIDFSMAHQRVGAAVADAEQAGILEVDPGSALVVMSRTAMDSGGRPIEHGHHVYRADMYTFDITLVN